MWSKRHDGREPNQNWYEPREPEPREPVLRTEPREPELDFGVEKMEMLLGPSLGVVFYAEFEFSNENRIGAHLGVVLGELLIWVFLGFSIFFSYLSIFV